MTLMGLGIFILCVACSVFITVKSIKLMKEVNADDAAPSDTPTA